MGQKLLIAQPTAWMRELPTVAQWKANLVAQLIQSQSVIDGYMMAFCNKSRIHNSRNGFVDTAIKDKYDWLLFVDPDMYPDMYFRPEHGHSNQHGDIRQFFPTAMGFMLQNPDVGVVAAPACAGPPELYVNIYIPHIKGGHVKLPRDEAAEMKPCMLKVGAIGTGLMLIRMSIFEKMKPPYFADTYRNEDQVDVSIGQDCYFCERVIEAGYGVYANMYSWAGHWKDVCVGKPGADGFPLEGMKYPAEEKVMEDLTGNQLKELVGA